MLGIIHGCNLGIGGNSAVSPIALDRLAVVFLCVLLWMLISGRLPWLGHRTRSWNGPALLLFGLLAMGLGFYGWKANGTADGHIDAMYLSVQQLYFNAPQDGADHWALQVSRIFVIASVVLISAEVIRRLYDNTIQGIVLLIAMRRVVIIGFGETGTALFREIVDLKAPLPVELTGIRRKHVVVIELDERNDQIRTAKIRGMSVIVGDGVDPAVLKQAGAHRANRVFFAMASDQQNMDAAAAIAELRGGGGRGRSRQSWYVHLRDIDLERVLADVLDAKGEKKRVQLHVFNVLDLAARDVLEQYLMDLRPLDERQVLHCIIVGFGKMGQLLTRRIAESAHYENLKRTRMTVVYSADEQDHVSDFIAMHPALFGEQSGFDPWDPDPTRDEWSCKESESGVSFVCNGGFVRDGAAPRSRAFIERVIAVAKTRDVLPAVLLCDDASDANSAAFALRTELDSRFRSNDTGGEPAHPVHIFSYIPGRPPIAYAMGRQGLTMFGAVSMVCTLESVTGSLDRKLAVAFTQRYNASNAEENKESKEPEEWEVTSNLAAARHVHAKLAAIGLSVSSVREGFTPTPTVIDANRHAMGGSGHPHSTVLAKMEHNRWMAERLMAGWRFGTKSNELRERKSLLHWGELPTDEREKDYNQIDETFAVCSDANQFSLVEREARLKWGAARASLDFIQGHPSAHLVIGWTGHRNLNNAGIVEEALEVAIGTLLKGQRFKSGKDAVVSGYGSLAIGADLSVTKILQDRGVPYDLILPTTTDESDEIDRMIQGARSENRVQPMAEQNLEYRQLTNEIVDACDVLVAVWDGRPARGPGGTAEVVGLARSIGKPVIVVCPADGSGYLLKGESD